MSVPVSYIFVVTVCCSITINLSFLYYSGILDTTAKNLDEISKLTNAVGRVAGGIADYLDVFHRLERLEQRSMVMYELPTPTQKPPLLQLPQTNLHPGNMFSRICPDFLCANN